MTKRIVILIALVVSMGGIGYAIISQSYPIALVNLRPISSREFNSDLAAGLFYYEKVNEAASRAGANVIDVGGNKKNIEAAVITSLIEDNLVSDELQKRISRADIETITSNKIDITLKSASTTESNMEREVQALYGLNLDDFKKNLLEPQARKEILQGRMFLESNSSSGDAGFARWLNQAKSDAKVFILLPGFAWEGGKVVVK